MKKIFLLLIILVSFSTSLFANWSKGNQVPKNVILLNKSSCDSSTTLTLVDLDNSEMVIILIDEYNGKIIKVHRTGMIVNVDLQIEYQKSKK